MFYSSQYLCKSQQSMTTSHLQLIIQKFIIKITAMYKPKSPTASNKPINFSPSPQARRKINYAKPTQQQNAPPKQRVSFLYQEPERHQRKSPLSKKGFQKNLQIDSVHTIDSFKIKQSTNNQTPKFCIRAQQPKCSGNYPRSNPVAASNFFSFGEKWQQKIKTQRKVKEMSQKQVSKSPKQMKKKSNNLITTAKNKPDLGIFESSTKSRKQNQSYLR